MIINKVKQCIENYKYKKLKEIEKKVHGNLINEITDFVNNIGKIPTLTLNEYFNTYFEDKNCIHRNNIHIKTTDKTIKKQFIKTFIQNAVEKRSSFFIVDSDDTLSQTDLTEIKNFSKGDFVLTIVSQPCDIGMLKNYDGCIIKIPHKDSDEYTEWCLWHDDMCFLSFVLEKNLYFLSPYGSMKIDIILTDGTFIEIEDYGKIREKQYAFLRACNQTKNKNAIIFNNTVKPLFYCDSINSRNKIFDFRETSTVQNSRSEFNENILPLYKAYLNKTFDDFMHLYLSNEIKYYNNIWFYKKNFFSVYSQKIGDDLTKLFFEKRDSVKIDNNIYFLHDKCNDKNHNNSKIELFEILI